MKHLEQDAQLTAWASPQPVGFLSEIISFINKTLVITELEIRKLRHDPSDLVTRAVQPALWLLIFGGSLRASAPFQPVRFLTLSL